MPKKLFLLGSVSKTKETALFMNPCPCLDLSCFCVKSHLESSPEVPQDSGSLFPLSHFPDSTKEHHKLENNNAVADSMYGTLFPLFHKDKW